MMYMVVTIMIMRITVCCGVGNDGDNDGELR